MKRFGIVILALMAFAMGSLSFASGSLAEVTVVESRIYMGMNIPVVEGCLSPQTKIILKDSIGEIPIKAEVGPAAFGMFLEWVNKEHGFNGADVDPDFGYTVFDTRGFYKGEEEASKVMLLFFAKDKAEEIGSMFQKAFCQDSVYVNTITYDDDPPSTKIESTKFPL